MFDALLYWKVTAPYFAIARFIVSIRSSGLSLFSGMLTALSSLYSEFSKGSTAADFPLTGPHQREKRVAIFDGFPVAAVKSPAMYSPSVFPRGSDARFEMR